MHQFLIVINVDSILNGKMFEVFRQSEILGKVKSPHFSLNPSEEIRGKLKGLPFAKFGWHGGFHTMSQISTRQAYPEVTTIHQDTQTCAYLVSFYSIF